MTPSDTAVPQVRTDLDSLREWVTAAAPPAQVVLVNDSCGDLAFKSWEYEAILDILTGAGYRLVPGTWQVQPTRWTRTTVRDFDGSPRSWVADSRWNEREDHYEYEQHTDEARFGLSALFAKADVKTVAP